MLHAGIASCPTHFDIFLPFNLHVLYWHNATKYTVHMTHVQCTCINKQSYVEHMLTLVSKTNVQFLNVHEP